LSEVVSKTGTIFKNEVKTIIRDNLDDDSQKQSVKFLYGIFEKWWGYNKELNKQIRDNGFIELSSIDIINLRIIESSGPLEERMLFITVKWHDPATSKVWKGNLAALSSLESSGFVVRDGFKRKGIQLTEFARMLLDLGLIKEKQVENKDGNKNKDIIIPSAEWNILNKIKSRKPLINLSDYSGEIKALIKRGLLKGGKDGSFEFTKKYYELFGEGKIRKGKKPQKSKTSDSISRGNIFCEFVKRVIENIIAGKKRTEIFKGINRWELQYTTGTAFNSAQKRVDVLLDDIIFELYEGEAVAQGINDVDIISEEGAVGFNNLRDGLVQKIINRVKDLNVSLEQLFYVFTLILWGSIKNKSKEDIRFYSDFFPLIADEIVKKLGYSSKLIKENGRLFIVVLDNDKKYRFALKETFGMNNQQRALYMTDRRSADGGNKTDIAEYATIIYHGKKISEEEILIWISQERKYLDCLSDLKEEENECMWNESLKNTIINTTPGVKAFLNVFNHVGIINYWLRSGPEVIARLILGSFYIMVLVIFKGVEDPFMKFISIEFALILFVYMATCFMSIIKPAAMLGQKIIINSYFRISGKDLSYREYLQAVFGHEFIHQNAERLGIDKKGEYVLANAYKYLRFSKGEKEEIINMFLSLSGTHLDEVTKEKVKKEMTLFAFSLEDSNLKEIMEIGKIIASKGKNWERILRVFETLDTEHSFEIEFVAAICAITVSSLYQDNKLEAIKLLKYLSKGESLNTVGQWAKKERIRIDGNKPLRAIDRDGGAEEIEITWIKDSREMSNIGGRDLFVTRMVIQNSLFEKDHDLYHEIIQNLISDEKEKIVLNGVEGQYWYSTCFRHYYILIFKTNKGTNFIVFGVSEADNNEAHFADEWQRTLEDRAPLLARRRYTEIEPFEIINPLSGETEFKHIIVEEYINGEFAGEKIRALDSNPEELKKILVAEAKVYCRLYEITQEPVIIFILLKYSRKFMLYPKFLWIIKTAENGYRIMPLNYDFGETSDYSGNYGEMVDYYFKEVTRFKKYPDTFFMPMVEIFGIDALKQAAQDTENTENRYLIKDYLKEIETDGSNLEWSIDDSLCLIADRQKFDGGDNKQRIKDLLYSLKEIIFRVLKSDEFIEEQQEMMNYVKLSDLTEIVKNFYGTNHKKCEYWYLNYVTGEFELKAYILFVLVSENSYFKMEYLYKSPDVEPGFGKMFVKNFLIENPNIKAILMDRIHAESFKLALSLGLYDYVSVYEDNLMPRVFLKRDISDIDDYLIWLEKRKNVEIDESRIENALASCRKDLIDFIIKEHKQKSCVDIVVEDGGKVVKESSDNDGGLLFGFEYSDILIGIFSGTMVFYRGPPLIREFSRNFRLFLSELSNKIQSNLFSNFSITNRTIVEPEVDGGRSTHDLGLLVCKEFIEAVIFFILFLRPLSFWYLKKIIGIKKGDNVLDLGCGVVMPPNQFNKITKDNGVYAGLDIDTKTQQINRVIDDKTNYVIGGYAGMLPFKTGTFDLILMFNLPQYDTTEIYRCLKPNGKVIVFWEQSLTVLIYKYKGMKDSEFATSKIKLAVPYIIPWIAILALIGSLIFIPIIWVGMVVVFLIYSSLFIPTYVIAFKPKMSKEDKNEDGGVLSIKEFLQNFRLFLSKLGDKIRILLSIVKKGCLVEQDGLQVFIPLEDIEEKNFDCLAEYLMSTWGMHDLRVYDSKYKLVFYNYIYELLFISEEMYDSENENLGLKTFKNNELNNIAVSIFGDLILSVLLIQWLDQQPEARELTKEDFFNYVFNTFELTTYPIIRANIPEDYTEAGSELFDGKLRNPSQKSFLNGEFEYPFIRAPDKSGIPLNKFRTFEFGDEDMKWTFYSWNTLPRRWVDGLIPEVKCLSVLQKGKEKGKEIVLFPNKNPTQGEELREATLSRDGKTLVIIKNTGIEVLDLETYEVVMEIRRNNVLSGARLLLNEPGIMKFYKEGRVITYLKESYDGGKNIKLNPSILKNPNPLGIISKVKNKNMKYEQVNKLYDATAFQRNKNRLFNLNSKVKEESKRVEDTIMDGGTREDIVELLSRSKDEGIINSGEVIDLMYEIDCPSISLNHLYENVKVYLLYKEMINKYIIEKGLSIGWDDILGWRNLWPVDLIKRNLGKEFMWICIGEKPWINQNSHKNYYEAILKDEKLFAYGG
ncbi:MAG: methyltransferase domain-containing protein, partial [Candidatus Omnitrophica bacterium]|nr:methyltransferase domain-containing protein [Candidatus Omnitrophota bacterium]